MTKNGLSGHYRRILISQSVTAGPPFTHRDLLNLWRPEKVLAGRLGVTPDCVRKWKTRNFIPPQYWPKFIEVLHDTHHREVSYREMTYATLHRLKKVKP